MKTHMMNTKIKSVAAGVALVIGLATASVANAQTSTEPWTGAIPGDTIQFPGDSSLKGIRKLLNEGKIDRAVNLAKRNVRSIDLERRSGKTSSMRYDAYNALCISLAAQKSFDAAKEACDTAIEEAPKRWMAYNSRGTLNLRSGDFAAALSDYNMALENAPSSSDIRTVLEHNVQLAQSKR